MSDRRDPIIGTLPDIDEGAHRRHASQPRSPGPSPSRPTRALWFLMMAAIVTVPLLAIALYKGRDALGSRLLPPSQHTQLMQRADAALRAGKLTATDGRGARELYEAVLARDPDDLAAREGLVHVGTAALGQAQIALGEQRPQDAQHALDLARVLAVPVGDLQPIEDALRHREHSDDQLAALLAQAETAEHAGHLDDGERSALARYQQALAASPDNAVVLARRQALLGRMLAGMDGLLANNDIAGAQRLVDRVVAVDAGHLDLPAARARLGAALQHRQAASVHSLQLVVHSARSTAHSLQNLQQARARRAGLGQAGNNNAKIDDLLAAADHAVVRDELLDPPGDSAFDKLRAASAIAPGNPRVMAATRRFGATAVACFQREMTGNRLLRAEACLDALIAIEPTYFKLPSMRHNLAARWLAVAEERLGAGELDNAQRAIAAAQRWAPNDPAIPAMATRLRQARAGARR